MSSSDNKIEKLLVSLITALFFMTLLTPLIFSSHFYYPHVTLRNFLFRIIVEVQFVMWMVLIVKNKNFIPRFSRILLSTLAFILLIAISDLFGANPEKSFWGTFERMEGLVNLIHLLGFMFLGMSVLQTKKVWGQLACFSLLVATIVSGWSFRELLIDHKSLVVSTIGNSSYLGIYLAIHFILSIYLLIHDFKKEKKKRAFLFLIPAFLFLLTLYNTGARGSLLGMVAGLFVAITVYSLRKNQLKMIGIFIAALFIIGTGLWNLRQSAFIKNNRTLSRIVDINGSSSVRLKLWSIAIKGIKERPILGWGQENFDLIYDRHYDTSLGNAEPWFDRSHNVVLDWSVAGGILGCLAYLFIFIAALYKLWEKGEGPFENLDKSFITGLLVTYFVHNFFMFDYLMSYLFFFSMLAFISMSKRNEKNQRSQVIYVLPMLLLFFFIFNLTQVNPKGLRAAHGIVEALQLQQLGNKDQAFEKIKEVSVSESFGRDEIFDELGSIALSGGKDMVSEAQVIIKNNEASGPKNLKRSFMSFRLNAFLAGSELDKNFSEMLSYSPKRQVLYRVMIDSAFENNEIKKALKLSRENYDNDPSIHMARYVYALAALLNKDIKLSDSLMEGTLQENRRYDDKFIQGYSDLGLSGHIINFYKKAIMISPDNIDLHTRLGFYYMSLNKKEEAAIEFAKAQEMTQKKLSGHY